jgi:P pilus assembly chaperone PapD
MNLTSRRTSFAVAAFAAVTVAAPALAAPHLQSTSLNLRASNAVVKAHHPTTFTATLTSQGQGVSGQQILIEQRVVLPSGHKTNWTDKGTASDTGNGTYTFTVTPPIASNKNTQKDQYRAVFQKTTTYSGSHSEVITITVKRTTS